MTLVYRPGDLIRLTEPLLSGWQGVGIVLEPVPVPVSERLPGPGDCDEQGRCWWGDAGNDEFVPSWRLCEQPDKPCFDHWLPHWALPVPEAE